MLKRKRSNGLLEHVVADGTDYRYVLYRPEHESLLCLRVKPKYQEQHLQKYPVDQSVSLDGAKYTFIGYNCSIIKDWKERYFENK